MGAALTGRATVASFDVHVGLGVIATSDDVAYDFHCTAIADGTRTIEPGTEVSFIIGPAGPGRWEAIRLDPL